MRLIDLHNKVPDSVFWETCRTKLNGTLVTFEGKWWSCTISDNYHFSENTAVTHGSGKPWIYLSNSNTTRKLNSLEGIDTEPEWPKAGQYFHEQKTYRLQYKKGHIYKAGLSPNQIVILHRGGRLNGVQTMQFLDTLLSKKHVYPKIGVCRNLLATTPNTAIPLSLDMSISIHPYINGPVLTYNGTCVGVLSASNRVSLSNSHSNLSEYLDHLGVTYKNAA